MSNKCKNNYVGPWFPRFADSTTTIARDIVKKFFELSILTLQFDNQNHPQKHVLSENCRPHSCGKAYTFLREAVQIQVRTRVACSKSSSEVIIFRVTGKPDCIVYKALDRVVKCEKYIKVATNGVSFALKTTPELNYYSFVRCKPADIFPPLPPPEVKPRLPPGSPQQKVSSTSTEPKSLLKRSVSRIESSTSASNSSPPVLTTSTSSPPVPTTSTSSPLDLATSNSSSPIPKRMRRYTGQVNLQQDVPQVSCLGCNLNLALHEVGCFKNIF